MRTVILLRLNSREDHFPEPGVPFLWLYYASIATGSSLRPQGSKPSLSTDGQLSLALILEGGAFDCAHPLLAPYFAHFDTLVDGVVGDDPI
jgi:hypothetical protein